MRPPRAALVAISLLSLAWGGNTYRNTSRADLLQSTFSILEDRPEGCPKCPSCFNCNTPSDECTQDFGSCNKYNGKCSCPSGFGGDDCSEPLCDSLADGRARAPRSQDQKYCECKEGWEGINCNVCQTDQACDAMMPEKKDGICYKQGVVVNQNYQMCDITNQKILDQLKEKKPQVTFSCTAEPPTCKFQCQSPVLRI